MSALAIQATGLGKMYRIGAQQERYRTLRDTMVQMAKRPIERIRHPGAATHKSEPLWALRNIDLEVRRGETVGIVGGNGAGKSTLLKILSHITEPTEGRVEIRGRVGSLLEVGTGFHPELTGRENVMLSGAILGMSKKEILGKFEQIVEFSEIGSFLETPVKRFSSGMYVRLAFAVAAHLDPDILLVDEVLAVGDASFQKKCLGTMNAIAGEGRTVIFVSHNMGAITNLCQRGIVLRKGQMIFDGESSAAVQAYLKDSVPAGARSVLIPEIDPSRPISIHRVAVTAPNRSETEPLDVADELSIEIDYSVSSDIRGSNLAIALKKEGVLVFRSWDIDNSPAQFELREKGSYSSRIPLPPRLLAPGTYSISVSTGRPGKGGIANHEDCLMFELDNFSEDTSHKSFSRGGLLLMPLDWQTSRSDGT